MGVFRYLLVSSISFVFITSDLALMCVENIIRFLSLVQPSSASNFKEKQGVFRDFCYIFSRVVSLLKLSPLRLPGRGKDHNMVLSFVASLSPPVFIGLIG